MPLEVFGTVPVGTRMSSSTGALMIAVAVPYATREQAEATGKSLGMPSFVITPQDQPAQ